MLNSPKGVPEMSQGSSGGALSIHDLVASSMHSFDGAPCSSMMASTAGSATDSDSVDSLQMSKSSVSTPVWGCLWETGDSYTGLVSTGSLPNASSSRTAGTFSASSTPADEGGDPDEGSDPAVVKLARRVLIHIRRMQLGRSHTDSSGSSARASSHKHSAGFTCFTTSAPPVVTACGDIRCVVQV